MKTGTEEKDSILCITTHEFHKNPKVSVIVPVYKVDKYLTQCLNSITNQTLEEIEIIIVDEDDHDRCREIIDFFEKKDPRVVAPHRKNGGYGASCNLGLEMARGEYIAIVESDDYIEPEMYEEMYEYARMLNADVVKTPYYETLSDGRSWDCLYRKFMRETTPKNECFSAAQFGTILRIHPSVWSALYKAEYINRKNIRFEAKKGASYVDCSFRKALVNTDKIAWLDKPYYHYRIDNENSTVNNFKIGQMITRWEEFFSLFDNRKEEFDRYYAEHLVGEVCRNLFDQIQYNGAKPTDEDYERIGKLMFFFPEEVILASDELSPFTKKEMISCRNDPAHTKKILTIHNGIKAVKVKIHHFSEININPTFIFFLFIGFEVFAKISGIFYGNQIIAVIAAIISLACAAGMLLIVAMKYISKMAIKCYAAFHKLKRGKTS